MRLFEGGIYSKMTKDEYQKLRHNQQGNTEQGCVGGNQWSGRRSRSSQK